MLDNKYLLVTMPNGSKWKVPVHIIAMHRAKYYAEKEHVTLEQSLKFDTIPLFEEDEYEIEDWASNNMNWSDVEKYAIQIKDCTMSYDEFQDGWINGNADVVNE